MFKANRKYILLLLIFAFAFAYRLTLMLWASFPPGADIGLHNSVISSITQSGNTNFLWNNYQMGGGLSLTFPGYHLFAAGIIMMTGLPDYIAQPVIVALFSSLLVFVAYLVTRSAWTESGALIVAFIVAVSRPDMEILLWGGYPNVITLLLTPVTFYLYLQKARFTLVPFLVSTSILVGSIYLTHSLSAAVFVAITGATVLPIMVSPKSFATSRKHVFYWLLPLALGAILVSPFLISAIPAYLHSNSSFIGISAINSAILSTRVLPLTLILPLFACTFLFFFLSKEYKGRFLSVPALLLFMWLFVPTLLTQGFLVGLIVDYNRFLYFLVLPVLILIGLFIERGSFFFAHMIDSYSAFTIQIEQTKKNTFKTLDKVLSRFNRKTLYASFIIVIMIICIFAFPIFMTPQQGIIDQSFYQVMDNPGYQAIQWAKQNTLPGSVFVSDALYGWWLGGFAQRPTLSAVDPQYLTLAREFPIAKNASNLLDTDYLVDNSLVQIREDGGYIARHNPEILADLNWTYFPYSFFTFDSNQNEIKYEVNGILHSISLDKLEVKEMWLENAPDHKTVAVIRGNNYFNYTQFTTVNKGLRFVNLTSTINSIVPDVTFVWVDIDVQSKGASIYQDSHTIGLVDAGVKTLGQLIFQVNQPDATVHVDEIPTRIHLEYSLNQKSHGQFQIMASAYSADNNPDNYKDSSSINKYFIPIIAANLNYTQNPVDADFKESFDYRAAMQTNNVSYVVCRNTEMQPKFLQDPAFNLVFINSEIAIFKVKGNINLAGS
jgi:hypothetical protein